MADNLENLDELNMGSRGRKKPKVLIYLVGGIFLLFVIIFAYFKFTGKSTSEQAARVQQAEVAKSAAKIDNTATDTDSEVYRSMSKEEDIERANRAEAQGRSAIPRLMQDSKVASPPLPEPEPEEDDEEDEDETPPPPPPYAKPAPPPQYKPSPEASSNLASFLSAGNYSPGSVEVTSLPDKKKPGGAAGGGDAAGGEDAPRPGGPDSEQPQLENIQMTPGTLLYAVMDIGANSDDGSTPIMATVVSGKYNGAKLIGGFQRRDQKLIVQFNRMVVTNKKGESKVYGMNGYGINPDDYSAGMASSVDNHYLARWGGLIASSFLEGFGDAKSRSGTTYSYGNDYNPGQFMTDYDLADEAWIAAGKVGEELSDKFDDMFDMPPTVRLDPGTPIGVLVL